MKTVLNEYMIADSEISSSVKEIGLIFINENGKILIKNDNGIINIPRIRSMYDEINVKNKIKGLLGTDNTDYYLLQSLINYRPYYRDKYGLFINQKTDVDYYVVKVDSKDIDKQFTFLSIPHIKSLLSMKSFSRGYEYIKEELDLVFNKISVIYENKQMVSSFNVGDYANHLVSAYYFNGDNKQSISKRRKSMQLKHPYINYKNIYDNTLEFVSDIYGFAYEKKNNELKFNLERIIPVKAPTDKLWYSDILLIIYKDNLEYLVSLYLLSVLLDNDFDFILGDEALQVMDNGKNVGSIDLLPEFIISAKKDKNVSIGSLGRVKKLVREKIY